MPTSESLPEHYRAWQLFGAGFENIGENDQPSELELREPKANEILCRSDALGLCLSDMKIIKQGNQHARLRGRDLAAEPTVLGHECACTVIAVGEDWKDQFEPGQRFVVQADIYYKGFNYAFGYLIPGGLAEYFYLDERALAGDEGCYLLPVKDETGFSESALSEPWACVEMSYRIAERFEPGTGKVLIVTDSDIPVSYENSIHVPRDLEGLPDGETFDDILLWDATPALVEVLGNRLNKGGAMFIFGEPSEEGDARLDIGRIHYEDIRFFGGGDTLEVIQRNNERMDLLPGGAALFIGAGGPMGQMHVQRAVEKQDGPDLIVATDLDKGRLAHIQRRFGAMAEARGATLKCYCPADFADAGVLNEELGSLVEDGYDDICILAPVAGIVTDAMPMAADGAIVNVFAGVIVGSEAPVPIQDLCRGVKIMGSSGSRIADMRTVMEKVEAKALSTNLSVAAIGGLLAAKDGLAALRDAVYPGKTIIYPQCPDVPLMSLEEVPTRLPELAGTLGPNGEWTKEAEAALIAHYGRK
jgi:threonine dehydrogenase-like Zn-dependent dehydrogenase